MLTSPLGRPVPPMNTMLVSAYVQLRAEATNSSPERHRLLQSTTTAQNEELKTLSARNNELQAHVRHAEIKIGELSSTLAEYSSTLAKAQSESQLLRNEKALQKVRISSFWWPLYVLILFIVSRGAFGAREPPITRGAHS